MWSCRKCLTTTKKLTPAMNARTLTAPPSALPAERHQSALEEQVNALSHGIGFVLAAATWPILNDFARAHGGSHAAIGASVFSLSMMLVYAASMIYHALPRGRAKVWARRFDHAAIFIFIAGSYTPFALGPLRDSVGWPLLVTVWTMALAGVACKVCGRLRRKLPSTFLYVCMGWLALAVLDPLMSRMGPDALRLLLAGGAAYTVGAVFFLFDQRLRFGHFVWHLFVLAGSTCHFFAALGPGA